MLVVAGQALVVVKGRSGFSASRCRPAGGDAPHGLERTGGPMAEWGVAPSGADRREEIPMGKTGRKRRARRKNKANHGKRPNA